MTREEATKLILEAKRFKGMTFADIAGAVKRHKVWTTAALMGQASMSKDEADLAVAHLGLPREVSSGTARVPNQGFA